MGVRGDLGTELRALRVARGLSLVEAARRAGASRSSLNRWENGESAPGNSALLRLLEGLRAEARDRARLLAAATPQRAQVAVAENPLGSLAPPGALLRALREAQGETQAELAAHLGVGQPTVAKWEAGRAMPAGETLARALAHLNAAEAGLREDSLDLHEPITDPLDGRVRLREEVDRYPAFSSLQMMFILALERELWRLAVRDPRWEAALVEAMAWRSWGLMMRFDHTAALELANRALRLAESSGAWDGASLALNTLLEIRRHRGASQAALDRTIVEFAPRFRNPFVRAEWLSEVAVVVGRANRARGREVRARAIALVRDHEPDEMFGGQKEYTFGHGMAALDLERMAILRSMAWDDLDEAERIYERSFAHRWEEAVRFDCSQWIVCEFHRRTGQAPPEGAREAYSNWFGPGAPVVTWDGMNQWNRYFAPWLGLDPLPPRPIR